MNLKGILCLSAVGAVVLPLTLSGAFAGGMMGQGNGMMSTQHRMMMGSRSFSAPEDTQGQAGTADTPSDPVQADPAQAGRELFEQQCAACHGETGAGGLRLGNTVSADLRHPSLSKMFHGDDTAVEQAILTGTGDHGQALSQSMPRFQGQLSRQQVSAIVAYLNTLR